MRAFKNECKLNDRLNDRVQRLTKGAWQNGEWTSGAFCV